MRPLDATGGNVCAVRDFSRHASTRTVMLYDDRHTPEQSEIATLVAGFAMPKTVRGRARR
jgi:hypothetical protein